MKTDVSDIDTTRWSRCNRDTRKLDHEIKRSCKEKGVPLHVRQTGSHRIYEVPKGSACMPMHGELPKGTWGSLWRTLVALGIAILIVAFYLELSGGIHVF